MRYNKIVDDYIKELSELDVANDFDLVSDLAKSYQDNYPNLGGLYEVLVNTVLQGGIQ